VGLFVLQYYHDPITKRQFRSKKKVFHFLKKWEWSKGTPKEKLEGEFGVETKSLSRITPHFYSSMDTIIHHSGYVNNVSIPTGTPILGFHDPAVLQNTVDPYTYKRQLTRNFDVLVDNNHVAPFLSHPSPMVATIHELRSVNNLGIPTTTPVPRFYDSASSESTLRSDAISRQLIGSSNVPFQNKHAAPLHPYAPPMFGFNPELGVVNSVRIATATHISHIYHSAPSQSAINPDTITPPMFGFTPQLGVVNNVRIPTATPISHIYHSAPSQSAINPDTIWRSTKFQRVSNNLQGSWAPRFTEEKKQWVSNNLKGSWSPRFIEEKKQW
jgi:hypothetical protein